MAQHIGLTPYLIDAILSVNFIDPYMFSIYIPGDISFAVGGVCSNVNAESVSGNGIWHNIYNQCHINSAFYRSIYGLYIYIPGVISLAVGGVFSNFSSASVMGNGIWHNMY